MCGKCLAIWKGELDPVLGIKGRKDPNCGKVKGQVERGAPKDFPDQCGIGQIFGDWEGRGAGGSLFLDLELDALPKQQCSCWLLMGTR